MTTPHDAETPADHFLLITRVFHAPRELVWKAWTESERLAQWWGPRGFTTRVEQLDLRPGGRTRYVMVGPDGQEYPAEGVFLEIDPPRRFVTTDEFGKDFDPKGMDLPQGIVLTAEFEELPGEAAKTRVTLRIAHPTAEDRRKHEAMGVVAGWQSSFDCLDEYLASDVAQLDRSTGRVATRQP